MSETRIKAGKLMLLIQVLMFVYIWYSNSSKCNDCKFDFIQSKIDNYKKCKDLLDTTVYKIDSNLNSIRLEPIESILITYPQQDGVVIHKEYNFARNEWNEL